jgi:DNA polymerase elongation subunit (family B)
MKTRGQLVDAGSRLEYVITTNGGHKAKQYIKVEDSVYFKNHRVVLRIDYLYYLKLLFGPGDQLLNVAYFGKETEKDTYKYTCSRKV